MARIHKSDIKRWTRFFEAHPIDDPTTEFDITLTGKEGDETYVLTTDLTHADLVRGLNDVMALNNLHKMYVVGTKLREVRNGHHPYEEFKLWGEFHELAEEVCDLIAGSGFVRVRELYLS